MRLVRQVDDGSLGGDGAGQINGDPQVNNHKLWGLEKSR